MADLAEGPGRVGHHGTFLRGLRVAGGRVRAAVAENLSQARAALFLVFARMWPFSVFILLMFVAGIAVGSCCSTVFTRVGEIFSGHRLRCLLALPALLSLIARSRSAIVRWVSWSLLPLHYWAGIVHLYIFVFLGHL